MKIKISAAKLSAALVVLSENSKPKTKETGGVWVLDGVLFSANSCCFYTDDIDCNKKGASIFIPTDDVQNAIANGKQNKNDCITFEKIGKTWYIKAKECGHLTANILEATKGDIASRQIIIKKSYRAISDDDAQIFDCDHIALGLRLFKTLHYGLANVKLLQEQHVGLIVCDSLTNAKFHIMPMQWKKIELNLTDKSIESNNATA